MVASRLDRTPALADTRTQVHEVRKTVTVLFADVVASTALGERLDPEALRQVVTRYFAEMAEVLERHGGTVEKFVGDEVMAVFGVPAVHEDDALRAVRAAAAMHERLRALNEELEATWGARLAIRIGINTGEVMAGDPSAGHGFVTGTAVNIAKRLEQAAEPGEILLGDATHRLVRHAVTTTPIGPISLRGKRDAESPQRLEEVGARGDAVARHLDVPLVGRTRELGRLSAAYERAVEDRTPQLLTLVGHAGVGKSRLAGELFRQVEHAATVLVGRCVPYGEGVTFWPIRELFPDEPLEGTNDEIFLRIRRRLEALARERPLVVCFDDLHWAEPAFLDLVQYLRGWIQGVPLLLLCLARPDLLERRADWLTADGEALRLGPLLPAETSALLDYLDAPAGARKLISEAAEGNALFLEQMVALAAEQRSSITVPPSIRALLAARLDRLEPAELAVMECASVVGREFTLRAVSSLLPTGLEARAGALLLGLARKELVRPDPTDEGGFQFWHGLIREAAYERISKHRRAELHARHAEELAAAAAERVLVGYHLEQAALLRRELGPGLQDAQTDELATRGGRLLGEAAARALDRGDVSAAQTLLRRALALLSEHAELRLELERLLARTLWAIGEIDDADTLLAAVVAGAQRAGDRRTEWAARLDRAQRRGMTGVAPAHELADVAAAAAAAYEELGDDAGLARTRRALAAHAFRAGAYGLAQADSTRALEHAQRAGDAGEEARSADLLCSTLLFGPAEAAAAARRCRELLERSRGNLLLEANVAASLSGLEAMLGRFEEARALYAQSRQIFGELGLRVSLAGVTQISGPVETLAGDLVAAERELRQGYEILSSANARSLLAPQAAMLASALVAQGRPAEAAPLLAQANESLGSGDLVAQIVVLTARAYLAIAEDDHRRAVAEARGAVTTGEATDALNLLADAWVALALAGPDAGDGGAGFERALELYERKGNTVAAARVRLLMGRALA
jgi:class 3 adenylate cyclase